MKKIAVIVVLLLALLLLILLFNRDREEQGPEAVSTSPEAAPPVYRDRPHQGLAIVHCALEVNGARRRTLGSGVPIYIKCIITNPLLDRALALNEFARLRPTVRNQDGTGFDDGLELITPAPESAPPGGVAVLTWVPAAPMPPGEYDIGLKLPVSLVENARGIDRVRVKPALLLLNGEPAGAGEISYHTRQIMAARGRSDQVLEQIKEELAEHPESLFLRLELVDTLEWAGDYQDAREELIQLGILAQQGQPHLPAWIITRDRVLQEKIAAAHDS